MEQKISTQFRDFGRGLGFKIRMMRDYLGYTITDISKEFGISMGIVGNYEAGKENPNLLYLHRLSKKCGMQLEDYLLETPDFVRKLYR